MEEEMAGLREEMRDVERRGEAEGRKREESFKLEKEDMISELNKLQTELRKTQLLHQQLQI